MIKSKIHLLANSGGILWAQNTPYTIMVKIFKLLGIWKKLGESML